MRTGTISPRTAAFLPTVLLAALLGSSGGCAAAQQDAGSRIDAERDVKSHFSQNYWCPEPEVLATGNAGRFEARGCGKSARYMCSDAGGCREDAPMHWNTQTKQRPQSLTHPTQTPPGLSEQNH